VGPGFARAVGGTSETDVWVVGENHQVWNSKGDGKWQMRDPGTDVRLEGVWGTGPDIVYAAPNINYILHWKGSWVICFSSSSVRAMRPHFALENDLGTTTQFA
jgi:hypothetical protein